MFSFIYMSVSSNSCPKHRKFHSSLIYQPKNWVRRSNMHFQNNSSRLLLVGSNELLSTLFLNTLCFHSLVCETIEIRNLRLLLFYLRINSMEQSPSWEANRLSASQKIPRILWNQKVQSRTHKCLPTVPIPSHLDPVHTPHPTFWRSILILFSNPILGLPISFFLRAHCIIQFSCPTVPFS